MGLGYSEEHDVICAVTGRVSLSEGSWIEVSIRSFRDLEPRICLMKHFTPHEGPVRKNPNIGRLNAECAAQLAVTLVDASERLLPFLEKWEKSSPKQTGDWDNRRR